MISESTADVERRRGTMATKALMVTGEQMADLKAEKQIVTTVLGSHDPIGWVKDHGVLMVQVTEVFSLAPWGPLGGRRVTLALAE
jgi:hypothetical protein